MPNTTHVSHQHYTEYIEEIERLRAEMGYHEAKDAIAQLSEHIAVLCAEIEREKARTSVYCVAGVQAMGEANTIRDQLAASKKTVEEANGKIESLTQRLTEMTAEADSHARLAVDMSQQLSAVLGIFSDYGEPLPTLEQCRERWDGLKQQLATKEEEANQRESFYANVLNEAEIMRVAERQKLTDSEARVRRLEYASRDYEWYRAWCGRH